MAQRLRRRMNVEGDRGCLRVTRFSDAAPSNRRRITQSVATNCGQNDLHQVPVRRTNGMRERKALSQRAIASKPTASADLRTGGIQTPAAMCSVVAAQL
jgi:hypothetical protein